MARLLDPNRDALPGDLQQPVAPPTAPTATSTPRPIRREQPEAGNGLTPEEQAYLQKFDARYGIDPNAARREQEIANLQAEEAKNMEAVNQFLLKERPQMVGQVAGERLGQAIKESTGSSVATVALGVAAGFERIVNIAPNVWNSVVRATGADADNLQATLGFAKSALDQQEGLPKAAGKMLEAATPALVAGFGGATVIGQAVAQVGSSLITAASADPEDSTLSEHLRGTSLEKVGIVGSVIDAVATHPDSTEPERRWKIFLEDLGMGAVVSGAVALWRGARSAGKRLGDAAKGTPNPVDVVVEESAAARVATEAEQRAAQSVRQGEQQAAGQMEFDFEAAAKEGVPAEAIPPQGTTAVTETLEESGQIPLGDVGTMPAPNRFGDDQTFAMDMVSNAREVLPDLSAHLENIGPTTHVLEDGTEYTVKAVPWVDAIDGKLKVLVTASKADGSYVGSVYLYPEMIGRESPALASGLTQVSEQYRRQGVASALYQYVDNYIGTLHPSLYHTQRGKNLWGNRVKPPTVEAQTDFVTEQAMARGLAPQPTQISFDSPELQAAIVKNADDYVRKEAESLGFTQEQAMEAGKKFDDTFNDTNFDSTNVGYTETVARLARVIAEQPQGRGPMTFREIADMGEEYAKDVEFIAEALGREAGDIYNAEATSGVSQIINNLVEDLFQKAQSGLLDDTPDGLAKFAEASANIERFMNILSGNASEQGRSLSINASRARMYEAGDAAVVRQVDNQAAAAIMLKRIRESGGVQEVKNMRQLVVDAIEEVRRTGAEIDEVTGAVTQMSKFQRIKDGLIYYRTSNLLTSPFTTGRAAVETSAAMFGRQLQNITNAAITSVMEKVGMDVGQDPMTWTRAYNEFLGMVTSVNEGFSAGWKSIRTGKSNSPVIRADLNELRPTAIQIDESGKEGYGLFMAKTLNNVGLANDLAGRRMLLGLDSLMGTMTYRGYIRGVAYNRAMHLAGDEKAAFLKSFMENPPKDVHEAAVDIAQQMGNSNKPTGWVGKFVANPIGGGVTDHPVTRDIAKLLFPFGNTRGASLENGLAKFPVANLLVKRVRDDLFSGDPARRTKAISESMVGIEAMGAIWGLFEMGVLTPVGTQDQRVLNQLHSEDGWRPGSIYIPGMGYKELPNVQALQVPLRMASLLYQYAKADTTEDDLGEMAAVGMAVTMQMFRPTDILGVVGTLNDMLEAAESGDSKKFDKVAAAFTAQFATSFVPFQPTGRAATQMLLDPEVKDFKSYADFTKQLEARIYATVPGLSERVPPKRNIFGEPVFIQRGTSLDYADVATENKKNLATLQAMRELSDYASMIPTTESMPKLSITEMSRGVPLYGAGKTPVPNMTVKLTPDEYDRMTFLAGNIKIQGLTLSEALHEMLIGGKASLDVGGNGLDTAAAAYIKRFHKDGEMTAEAYGVVVGAINNTINRFRGVAIDQIARSPEVRQRGVEQLRAADRLAKKNLDSIITYGGE